MVNKIVVLGVSGSGKSTIGQMLADFLHYPFFDGDNFHPVNNVEKMRRGVPLSDHDRQEWLITLNQIIQENSHSVVACSALKPEYRDRLKQGNPDVVFVYLKGSYDTIWQRHKSRLDHYFNGEEMLKSQFSTLIEPLQDEAISIDIQQSEETVLQNILLKLIKN